jgi:predicted TIM-barrel fold metal-dependent hydrolase
VTYIDEPVGIRYRHDVGIDNVMWSSDYPHSASTWPNSREYIERDFVGSPDEERWKIVRDNCAKLYGFDLKKLGLAQPVGARQG